MLGVTLRTVQLWANRGVLECWKTEGGHRRVLRESVERLLVARHAHEDRLTKDVAASASPGAPPISLRILVVEDEPVLQRLYRIQLPSWPMAPEVSIAGNGFEGLVLVGSLRPHLLITDLHMPEMDGFQMLRSLHAIPLLDSMEIVVVTGLDAVEVAVRGGLPDGIDLLPKPIPFAALAKIAERVATQNGCYLGGGA